MCSEIEAKLKVDSFQEIVEKLSELHAEFLEEQSHVDCYFDKANSELTNADKCLRLRRSQANQTERAFLTYKGAKEQDQFKKRREVETEVKDADSAEKLILALGYEKIQIVEKKRRVWQLDKCEIALDELPLLGTFVEIEGPDSETIANVQKKLGLGNLPHIGKSYALLQVEKLGQQNQKE